MQAEQLKEIKQLREEYKDIHSQVQQDVLKRLDKAFDAFFRRLKQGATPGYPRFKSGERYHSFTYPQDGYEIIGNRLRLSKIGHIKIKRHREIRGKIKTCTIKREGDQWFAIFAAEYELDPSRIFHPCQEEVGIDLGVKSFAVLSTGETIANPRYYRPAEEQIQQARQQVRHAGVRGPADHQHDGTPSTETRRTGDLSPQWSRSEVRIKQVHSGRRVGAICRAL
jgi:putative transposase